MGITQNEMVPCWPFRPLGIVIKPLHETIGMIKVKFFVEMIIKLSIEYQNTKKCHLPNVKAWHHLNR